MPKIDLLDGGEEAVRSFVSLFDQLFPEGLTHNIVFVAAIRSFVRSLTHFIYSVLLPIFASPTDS